MQNYGGGYKEYIPKQDRQYYQQGQGKGQGQSYNQGQSYGYGQGQGYNQTQGHNYNQGGYEVEYSNNYQGGHSKSRGRGGNRGRGGRGRGGRGHQGGHGQRGRGGHNYQNQYNNNNYQDSYSKPQYYEKEVSDNYTPKQGDDYLDDELDDYYESEGNYKGNTGKQSSSYQGHQSNQCGNVVIKEVAYDQNPKQSYYDKQMDDYDLQDDDTYGGESFKDMEDDDGDDYYGGEDYDYGYGNQSQSQGQSQNQGQGRGNKGQYDNVTKQIGNMSLGNDSKTQSQYRPQQQQQQPKTYYSNPLTFGNDYGFTQTVDNMIKDDKFKSKEISDSFVQVLMIAEKPSIARMITEVLSGRKPQNLTKGRTCLLTFDGYFKNAKAKFTVSAVAGHVYTSDFKEEHNKWNSIDAGDLYNVPIVKFQADKKGHMPQNLQRLADGKDILCLWLDCDKEGENICYEVIYNAFPKMNLKRYQQIYRAKFSSLTNKDLKYAFDNLRDPPNMGESLSVDCRQVIDLKIGVSFTRFLTSSILPGLDALTTCLSYGPCQTPTLWFCVNRQKEIHSFIPKDFYRPYIEVEIARFRHTIYHNKKLYNKKELDDMMKKIQGAKNVKVIDALVNKNTKAAPAGLNTVSLLRVASSYLKMSPHETMIVAEKLYTMGFITYPRTETTKYASSFDFFGALKNFENHPTFGKNVAYLIKNYQKPTPKGVDVGDHPPITPARVATLDSMKGDQWRLYDFICTHFFGSLSQAAEYQEITYKLEANGEIFEESALQITKEGFLMFSPWKRRNYIKDFPVLQKGAEYTISSVSYKADQTKPPDFLTESDLIKEMEKNHIGTDASMPVHIENISQRGYVKVDESRRLIPTKLGKGLIESLGAVDPQIIHPDARAKIEGLVDEVAHGKKRYDEVLKYALDSYKEKFNVIRVNYDKLLNAFGKYYTIDRTKLNKAMMDVRQKNNEYKQETFVKKKASEVTTDLNKCDECKDGLMYIDYDKFDKFCIFCTNCNRRTKIIRDALKIEVNKQLRCQACNSYYIDVEVENPFLNGDTTYTGCLLCDKKLS